MLDVKKLSGDELFLIREGLLSIVCFNIPKFIECHDKLKEEIDKEWMERTLKL